MVFLLFLVLAIFFVEAGTELLVKSQIFTKLRGWLGSQGTFIKEMISCGYCTSVWVAVLPALFLSNLQSWVNPVMFFPLGLLFLHRAANFLHNINDKHFDKYYSRNSQ